MTDALADHNPQATIHNSEALDGKDTIRSISEHSSDNNNSNIVYMLHRICTHYVNHANTN